MNTQLINQIKELPGVKEVTDINGMAVVVFEPRKPVLTTEDGVDIFDGDTYFIVNKITNERSQIMAKKGMILSADVFRFSTPESAQKWIDEHKNPKPIYTDPEDGTEFFDGDEFWYFSKDTCEVISAIISDKTRAGEGIDDSKIYKSRKLCELAIAKFIQDKYK